MNKYLIISRSSKNFEAVAVEQSTILDTAGSNKTISAEENLQTKLNELAAQGRVIMQVLVIQ